MNYAPHSAISVLSGNQSPLSQELSHHGRCILGRMRRWSGVVGQPVHLRMVDRRCCHSVRGRNRGRDGHFNAMMMKFFAVAIAVNVVTWYAVFALLAHVKSNDQ